MKQIIKKVAKKILPYKVRVLLRRYINKFRAYNYLSEESTQHDLCPNSYSKINQFILANVQHSDNLKILYIFPVIDWGFRFQRPQHLARGFALQDYKVFYFTVSYNLNADPGYTIISLENNIFEVRLNINKELNIYIETLPGNIKEFWLKSIAKMEVDLGITSKAIKLDHPFWIELVDVLNGTIIYDCMDDHEGFGENLDHIALLEQKAINHSDVLLVSSDKLYQKFSGIHKNCILIENACDYNFFSRASNYDEVHILKEKLTGDKVVGYFGAISSWFDIEIVEYLADKFPNYDFILIGSTNGCEELHRITNKHNVFLLGEKPYSILPSYLALFDVCLIPFKIIPLTLATNPVKMFEYLSQGKSIVSTNLPEVLKYSEVVYIGKNKFEFEERIKQAILEADDMDRINQRIKTAKGNSWDRRVLQLTNFLHTVKIIKPKVSVIVLTYNNLSLTKNCLYSLYKYSNYDNLEIIVVDNLSTDGTQDWLTQFASAKHNMNLIFNNTNLGFSAGNNIGIKHATGDYIVILNNDTFVSPDWIARLMKHFADPKVGMVGPVANNIGNQAQIVLPNYFTENDFIKLATANYYDNINQKYMVKTGSLAFFCVMIKQEAVTNVGLLDEKFGRGWFEDDDYVIRLRQCGYTVVIADDVLIHHEHSASFGKLDELARKTLFNTNKLYFEQKHGIKWVPHVTQR